MKKIAKLLVVTLCLVTVLFTAVACEKRLDGETTQELLGNVMSEEALSTAGGYTFRLNIKQNNETYNYDGDLMLDENKAVSGDLVFHSNGDVSAIAIRNNKFYEMEFDVNVLDGDLVTAVNSYIEKHIANFVQIDPEDMGDWFDWSDGLPADIIPTDALPDGVAEMFSTLAKNGMVAFFNNSKKTSDGYVLSVDLNKLFMSVWSKGYAVARKIDEIKTLTLSELWNSEEMVKLLQPLLKGVSGEQLKTLIQSVIETSGVSLPFVLPAAQEGEDAMAYVGRCLETIRVGVATIGSLRISDILQMVGMQDIDLTDALDSVKDAIAKAIKPIADGLTFELYFDNNKIFRGVVFGFQLSENSGYTTQPIDISFELNTLSTAPTLWNLESLAK